MSLDGLCFLLGVILGLYEKFSQYKSIRRNVGLETFFHDSSVKQILHGYAEFHIQ
jgi:hypothetical protein